MEDANEFIHHYSLSALWKSFSKSACAFPTMSSASLVRPSSASNRLFFYSSLSNSRRSRRDATESRGASVPASRARRHSVNLLE